MPRNFYVGIVVVAAIAGAGLVAYRTLPTPATEHTPTTEFGGVSLRIEYATTEAERERGLGGRAGIPDNYGMLFVFPREAPYGFWMKDMLVPLDIFWLDAKGQVVYIAADVAASSYPHVLYPTTPARYVLETAAGFASMHRIELGTPLLLKNIPPVSE